MKRLKLNGIENIKNKFEKYIFTFESRDCVKRHDCSRTIIEMVEDKLYLRWIKNGPFPRLSVRISPFKGMILIKRPEEDCDLNEVSNKAVR